MKTTAQFLLGIISSLLLTAGFVRAAERLDPVTHHSASSSVAMARPAPDCTGPCSLAKPAPDCTGPCSLVKPAPDCTGPCSLA